MIDFHLLFPFAVNQLRVLIFPSRLIHPWIRTHKHTHRWPSLCSRSFLKNGFFSLSGMVPSFSFLCAHLMFVLLSLSTLLETYFNHAYTTHSTMTATAAKSARVSFTHRRLDIMIYGMARDIYRMRSTNALLSEILCRNSSPLSTARCVHLIRMMRE